MESREHLWVRKVQILVSKKGSPFEDGSFFHKMYNVIFRPKEQFYNENTDIVSKPGITISDLDSVGNQFGLSHEQFLAANQNLISDGLVSEDLGIVCLQSGQSYNVPSETGIDQLVFADSELAQGMANAGLLEQPNDTFVTLADYQAYERTVSLTGLLTNSPPIPGLDDGFGDQEFTLASGLQADLDEYFDITDSNAEAVSPAIAAVPVYDTTFKYSVAG